MKIISVVNDMSWRENRKNMIFFLISFVATMMLHTLLHFFAFCGIFNESVTLITGIAFYFSLPLLAILYGFYSYAVFEKVIIPNLIFFATYSIFIGVISSGAISVIKDIKEHFFANLINSIPLTVIVVVLSLITSVLARWEYQALKK